MRKSSLIRPVMTRRGAQSSSRRTRSAPSRLTKANCASSSHIAVPTMNLPTNCRRRAEICEVRMRHRPRGHLGRRGLEETSRRLSLDPTPSSFSFRHQRRAPEICGWESSSRWNGKRILPVVCRPLGDASPPPRLRGLNYIFFYPEPNRPGSTSATASKPLHGAEHRLQWLREHTRYLQRASRWNDGGRPANQLLSGDDIAEAKPGRRAGRRQPEPTALQLDFIRASEAEAHARSTMSSNG